MTRKAARRIKKQSVRQMFTLKYYPFSQRLEQKCFERGKKIELIFAC